MSSVATRTDTDTDSPKSSKNTLLFAFLMVASLFFIWGFCHAMLDVLNKHFQDVLHVSKGQSGSHPDLGLRRVLPDGAPVGHAHPADRLPEGNPARPRGRGRGSVLVHPGEPVVQDLRLVPVRAVRAVERARLHRDGGEPVRHGARAQGGRGRAALGGPGLQLRRLHHRAHRRGCPHLRPPPRGRRGRLPVAPHPVPRPRLRRAGGDRRLLPGEAARDRGRGARGRGRRRRTTTRRRCPGSRTSSGASSRSSSTSRPRSE